MITRAQIQAVADKIAKEFQPEKIILFGSYAWGTPTEDSDVDLCVIKDVEDTRELARKINSILSPRQFPIDIVTFRPKKTIRKMFMSDAFYKQVVDRGTLLYAG